MAPFSSPLRSRLSTSYRRGHPYQHPPSMVHAPRFRRSSPSSNTKRGDRFIHHLCQPDMTVPHTTTLSDGTQAPPQEAVSPLGVEMPRRIPREPESVFHGAPSSEYHGHDMLSWSESGSLAIATDQTVYLWNSRSGVTEHLVTMPGQFQDVTALSWARHQGYSHSNYLAIAHVGDEVQLWDASTASVVRTMHGHKRSVGCMDWSPNGLLSTGARDGEIIHFDVRCQDPLISQTCGHFNEIIKMKWDPEGRNMASSGQDCKLQIWDGRMCRKPSRNGGYEQDYRARHTLHAETLRCPVTALAWCPFKPDTLATTGGFYVNTLSIWDTKEACVKKNTTTFGMVTGLAWSPHREELAALHHKSKVALAVYNTRTMDRMECMRSTRSYNCLTHMAQSPDGTKVIFSDPKKCTMTLWNVFDKATPTPLHFN